MSKSKPILFSTTMVQAILDGRKHQTRRVVNPQPPFEKPVKEYCSKGDTLWVRETWRTLKIYDHIKPSLLHPDSPIQYKASDFCANEDGIWGKTRPAIFMPKCVSRITLNVLSVGVCHLNPIPSEDAIKEGIEQVGLSDGVPAWKDYENDNVQCVLPRMSFMTLWESINGKGSWDKNPWVYVVEFEHAEVQP